MTLNQAPYTGDIDLDAWTSEVTRQVNSGELAGGTGDVSTGVDDEARPTVGSLTLGYQDRYLAVAYSTSADGTQNFNNDYTSITGTVV